MINFPIPDYLQEDIDALIKGVNDKVLHVDCLQDEVYGSINIALIGGEITEEQANYLRKKFVFKRWF